MDIKKQNRKLRSFLNQIQESLVEVQNDPDDIVVNEENPLHDMYNTVESCITDYEDFLSKIKSKKKKNAKK